MIQYCPECSAFVDALEIESYTGGCGLNKAKKITFFRCPKCYRPFLTEQLFDIVGDWGEDLVATSEPKTIFPATNPIALSDLPDRIARPYMEAVGCLAAGHLVAAAIMCRKTLEALCAEHGICGPNLASKLKKMRDSEVIDKRLFDWAEALRITGNEAVHDIDAAIPQQDAKDLVDFTHALIDYLFTFRQKFEAFMRRRTDATIGKVEPEEDLPF